MKISFDFDGTLSTEEMQTLCTKCIKYGIEVFVTTSRSKTINKKLVNNDDLYVVTDMLGIPRTNIIFTAFKDKYSFTKKFDLHFDDNFEEIFLINQHQSKCLGFLYEEKHNNEIIDY
tara:strand:+ start:3762 stop:4112 length:351 start_codon:yes stop_codon:yes gene_type:complete